MNFVLAQVDNATEIRLYLLKHHRIAVRDCTSFGMPDRVLIMPSIPGNNEKLLETFHQSCVISG